MGNLGLFKKSIEKNLIWLKPNLCRINLKKNEKLFNIEGSICIEKKKNNKQKLYVDVERVKIKNDTNLKIVIKNKKIFQYKGIEIKIECKSNKYKMISGATITIVIAKLIRKKLKKVS